VASAPSLSVLPRLSCVKSQGTGRETTVIGVDKCFNILTLVERRSGFAIIKKLRARKTLEVNAAAIHAITEHRKMFITFTLDTGTEFDV
jgi:IS30 family transposase